MERKIEHLENRLSQYEPPFAVDKVGNHEGFDEDLIAIQMEQDKLMPSITEGLFPHLPNEVAAEFLEAFKSNVSLLCDPNASAQPTNPKKTKAEDGITEDLIGLQMEQSKLLPSITDEIQGILPPDVLSIVTNQLVANVPNFGDLDCSSNPSGQDAKSRVRSIIRF